MRKTSLLLLIFMLLVSLARGQVTIGTTDYGPDLQGAINAAAENDTIAISGTLNLSGNTDLGLGTNTITFLGSSNAKVVFGTGGRFIFEQAKVRIMKSLIIDGDSVGDRGGVFKMGNAANLTLDGVTVDGGRSGSHGGAISNGASILTVRNSTFSNNRCALSGGAIFTEGNGSVSLYNSRFINNWAAAFVEGADGKGGAIAMVGSSTPGLYAEGCLFYQNNSRNHGGVFIFETSTARLINCTLAKNRCSNDGGVAFIWGPASVTFINSTLAYNTTSNPGNGPGIKILQNTNTLKFDNCIMLENRNAGGAEFDIQSSTAADIQVNNSILSGYSNNLNIVGSGNITGVDVVNPGLSSDINASGILAIAAGSQAVDLGKGSFLSDAGITVDQVGNTRNFAGGRVDAGAYELNGASGTGYVTLNGTSYGSDFGGAMIAAVDGDTVKVFGLIDISSSKDIDVGGLKVIVKGYNGATFKFSSAGGPGTGSRFVWATNATVGVERTFMDIDFIGDPNGQSDQGAIITMTKAGTLILERVSMSNGYTTAGSGGAIRLTGGATLRATNCLFSNNKAFSNGGAIYCSSNTQAIIKNSRFINNQAALRLTDGKGGAIAVNGTPLGLYAENCSFIGNKSFNHGGAFLFENAKATVINSTIAYDTCKNAGGVAFIWGTSNVTFVNNTVAFNATQASQGDGSGLKLNQALNNVSVRNCYFYKNASLTDGLYQDITSGEPATSVVVSGSILQGGANGNTITSGGHNVVGSTLVKPGIAESLNGDYMLPLIDSTGQAINLGDTVGIASLIRFDQRNEPRDFIYGMVDAGAYEMQNVLGAPPVIWPDSSAYLTYKNLSMTGYQGWFSAEGDGSGQSWVHYAKNGTFAPGSCVIDFWPDMRETSAAEQFVTPFMKGNEPAAVYSPYVSATVNRHFQWMDQYGVDGAFMQRFVVDIMNPTTKARLNQVLKNALLAAKINGRAISVMYDLSGIDTTALSSDEYVQIIKNDWNELKNSVGIANYGDGINGENQPLLYHTSKAHAGKPYPLVTIWGVGFNDGRKYSVDFVSRLVDFFQNNEDAGQCAVMLGVPTYWRTGGSDVVTGTEYTRLINLMKKVDIVLPWHTGRFNRTDFNNGTYKNLVTADVAWCVTNNVEYAPVVSPGFSWRNLKNDPGLTGKPREDGMYYWDMAKAAVEGGVEMLYTGMFDEVNEGTQIFKVDNNPPVNTIPFLTYAPNAEDHYLWISGEVRRGLRGETTMGAALPARANESGFTSSFTFNRSDSIAGRTILALTQATSGHKIFIADPYSVPDGAPTLNISRDTSLFANELIDADTLDLNTFDQYLRMVEVDAEDKVIAFTAVLLDTSLLGSVADSTGFTDPAVNFRASYTEVGRTVLEGTPATGNSYWAAPIQAIHEFDAIYYKTARDTNVFKTTMDELTSGIAASDGDFIPVIEVNSQDEVLGFYVYKITKPQIGRLVNTSTDEMHALITVTYPGNKANVKVIAAEGYELYRTGVLNEAAALPFYGAPYTMYENIFASQAVTANFSYVTGQIMSFVEVKDGKIVAYDKEIFNPIPQISVEIKADPDLNLGEHTVLSLGEAPAAGNKIYLYPVVNTTDDVPRIGLDYAELAPLYTEEVDLAGISVPAETDDYYYLIETDGGNSVIGFSLVTLTAEDISIFADPAVHTLQSDYTVSVIGETTNGNIDVTVTPASGYTVYVSEIMSEMGRNPVYKSKTDNNPELTAYTAPFSLPADMGNSLIIAEYDAAGELTGIAIEEARDSALLVYYVGENGDDTNNGSRYRPFKTLEKALENVTRVVPIDSAATIYVSGIIQMQTPVTGDGTQISASVRIIGSDGATLTAAPNNRVIEMSNAKYYFENLTITGGVTTSTNGGAGIYLHGNSATEAEFKNCRFTGNTIGVGGRFGGAIRIVGAHARFTSCIFESNNGRDRGGAISISHGATDAAANYNIVFDGCYIANNLSQFVGTVEGHGGAIHITNSEAGNINVDIINSTIQGNEALSAGGAMFIEGTALNRTKIRVINSIITDNRGQNAGNGHGIRLVGAADNTLEIYNSLIWDNLGGSDGTMVDIKNDAGTVITCQKSFVKTLYAGTVLTGTFLTGNDVVPGVLKAALPAGFANSLFINDASSPFINYGDPAYLSAVGIDYDATFKVRNATDGKIEAGPTEYDPLKFDKGPEINNPIADIEVARNAAPTEIDLTDVFSDRNGDPFTYTITNNNESVVDANASVSPNLVLTYITDMEGDARIIVRGTTNNKFVEAPFTVKVGYAPYVVNPVVAISIPNMLGGSFTVDMNDVFADPDDDAEDIALSVIKNDRSDLITVATFDGKVLSYTVAASKQGMAVLTVKAKSGIRTALTTVTFSIGIPPKVINPIPGVAVLMNSAPVTRDLSNTFFDEDGNGAPIDKTIENNSNPGLVTPEIAGDLLTLTFGADKTGEAMITVLATSGDLTVTTSFHVLVTSTAQLVVINPIQPVKVEKNAPDSLINLSEVFYNMANPGAAIEITITGNSNTALVTTSLTGTNLTLGFADNMEGVADITLHAVSGAFAIDHVFQVGVGDIDLIVIDNPPADLQIGNNPDIETVVPLTGMFSVVGKPNAVVTVEFSYTNPLLLNAFINASNELIISSASFNTGSCVFTLTATYGNASVTTEFTVTILATGIARLDVKNIKLYPVPVKTVLYCSFRDDDEVIRNISNIQIISMTGMTVKLFDQSVIIDHVAELNLEDLATGSYLLRINSKSGSVTKMFIK